MDAQTLYSLGTALAFAGFLIMIVATAFILLPKVETLGRPEEAELLLSAQFR